MLVFACFLACFPSCFTVGLFALLISCMLVAVPIVYVCFLGWCYFLMLIICLLLSACVLVWLFFVGACLCCLFTVLLVLWFVIVLVMVGDLFLFYWFCVFDCLLLVDV